MTDRFSPAHLLLAHWRSLVDFRPGKNVDTLTIGTLVVVPIAAALAMYNWGTITQPAGWFTGVALLTGGLISSFAYVASLRLKLAERHQTYPDGDASDRAYLDETVAHILIAAYTAAVTALILVVGMNIDAKLTGIMAALPTLTSTYLLLLVTMVLPRLFESYNRINEIVRQTV
ncbi:hypothetical protein [Nocardioides pantholopis]|uniref:hypothetical protein n=1 Tax=Nocardioides pantholopis TaxID=2483798 RepID=UPI000FDB45EB|nr:hypothetical protein [Nocardioides pantholopis]